MLINMLIFYEVIYWSTGLAAAILTYGTIFAYLVKQWNINLRMTLFQVRIMCFLMAAIAFTIPPFIIVVYFLMTEQAKHGLMFSIKRYKQDLKIKEVEEVLDGKQFARR